MGDNGVECENCGEVMLAVHEHCRRCGVGNPGYLPGQGGSDGLTRMLLPVGRSGYAIAAGYLGLFSFMIFPAPLALIFGLLAIGDIRRNPQLHGMGRAIFGIVAGALGTAYIVVLLFGLFSYLTTQGLPV